jgi:aerobic-type carbon monoxide dehydrogenase small subunit (CoxS/CutS family)
MTHSTITIEINDRAYSADVEPRRLLSDFIREDAGLTGTHVGCEHGVCGACTVQLDGAPVRSCLMLAIQADGRSVRTVEGLADDAGLHPLQQAFLDAHGLQCGYCTPGFLMSLEPYIRDADAISEQGIREAISGNICRCTGYQSSVDAVQLAAEKMRLQEDG